MSVGCALGLQGRGSGPWLGSLHPNPTVAKLGPVPPHHSVINESFHTLRLYWQLCQGACNAAAALLASYHSRIPDEPFQPSHWSVEREREEKQKEEGTR